jgi:PAS domain S-box-containing protein
MATLASLDEPKRVPPIIDSLLKARPSRLLAISGVLIVAVAIVHSEIGQEISVGALYTMPVLVAAAVLNRWQLLLLALGCALMRVAFGYSFSFVDGLFRFLIAFIAYSGSGLFVQELIANRKRMIGYVQELQRQQALREEAEEQLRMLADSSPAAIFTLDENARVLSANRAALQLFGCPSGGDCRGVSVAEVLPVLADALKMEGPRGFFRTAAQCQGKRLNGQIFVAQTWFSTYNTPAGRRLAAIAVDCSEEVREREEQNLRQLQDSNRIVAAAVSHEIRNVCGAISVVYSNLARSAELSASEDFQALGKLVTGLERIAAAELHSHSQATVSGVDLGELLNHLRIIIEPSWEEIGGEVVCRVPTPPPVVLTEPFGLIQAFLNLAMNSLRAVQDCERKVLTITVSEWNGKVAVRFEDTGPGVKDPQKLFQLFQSGAEQVGLGLYVSRAILRSHGGDLRYETSPKGGACFVAELLRATRRGNPAA